MNPPLLLPVTLCLATIAAASPVARAQAQAPQDEFLGIGAGEEKPTHVGFETDKDAKIVKVSVSVIVDKASPNGLNFFAIQVNFPNSTWAHGGPQISKKGDGLAKYANWGGLVSRGGGTKDYKDADPKNDRALIECGVEKPNTIPCEWELGREYVLTVERGDQIALPPDDKTPTERKMWVWRFTMVPKDNPQTSPTFTSTLYNSADHISSFCVWNEAGYGSTSEEQHARWSLPKYFTEGDKREREAQKWSRF